MPGDRSYEELEEICARLEAEAGHHLVLQRDLNRAKTQVDEELQRFSFIQGFIEKSLELDGDEAFYALTLEALVEAFEFEVALYLLPGDEPDRLNVAGEFGFSDIPETLAFNRDWLDGEDAQILKQSSPALAEWSALALDQAIICPICDKNHELAGLLLGGLTIENGDVYEPITENTISAFTVMVRQAGAVWSNRQLTSEVVAQNKRLEVEAGRQIVMQRDLIKAKDQVDDELMRFKSIQSYIGKALALESDDAFFELTLESFIEAFELEIALLLRVTDEADDRMDIIGQFGFDEIPASLPIDSAWFGDLDGRLETADSDVLLSWSDLDLVSALISPYRDRDDNLAGAIVAGITSVSVDFYDEIPEDKIVPFSVMARQAGGLLVNRQLNAEVRAHNARLAALTDSYSRFVPFQFLDLLGRSSIEEIDKGDSAVMEMSVLFADIRGFTTLSEQLGPERTFSALNQFLSVVEPIISAEGGFINQYLGDAIMALFPASADNALRCAAKMLDEVEAFNEGRRLTGEPIITFGLGISTGPLMIGALGGGERLDSNVIGDTANLASRTEGLTKIYGVNALFTGPTFENLENPNQFKVREIDRVIVKGRAGAVPLYELIRKDDPENYAPAAEFNAAMSDYRAGRFDQALGLFSMMASEVPMDPVISLFKSRCENLAGASPGDWNGVWVFDEK